jgi:hypothetical protein
MFRLAIATIVKVLFVTGVMKCHERFTIHFCCKGGKLLFQVRAPSLPISNSVPPMRTRRPFPGDIPDDEYCPGQHSDDLLR